MLPYICFGLVDFSIFWVYFSGIEPQINGPEQSVERGTVSSVSDYLFPGIGQRGQGLAELRLCGPCSTASSSRNLFGMHSKIFQVFRREPIIWPKVSS